MNPLLNPPGRGTDVRGRTLAPLLGGVAGESVRARTKSRGKGRVVVLKSSAIDDAVVWTVRGRWTRTAPARPVRPLPFAGVDQQRGHGEPLAGHRFTGQGVRGAAAAPSSAVQLFGQAALSPRLRSSFQNSQPRIRHRLHRTRQSPRRLL